MSDSKHFVNEYKADYMALEGVPLLGASQPQTERSSDHSLYPGMRRSPVLAAHHGPPSNHVLIKTAGNALQAVPKETFETKQDLVAVTVPWNRNPGDTLIVQMEDGQSLQVDIPPGSFPGHTFFVARPPSGQEAVVSPASSNDLPLVASSDVSHDLYLDACTQPSNKQDAVAYKV